MLLPGKIRRKAPFTSFFLFVLFLFSTQLKAQEGFDIVARVMDEKGEPLFGNLLVLSPADSTLIKGIFFMEGKARISGIKGAPVLLKFTSMGIAILCWR